MQAKHIIIGILALVGLVFGVFNWINYFKSAPSGPTIQSLRPARNEQATLSETVRTPAASVSPENQAAPPETEPPRQKIQWPDTVSRNPFLTPKEIELIARGKFVKEEPVPLQQKQVFSMPTLKLSGLIMDRASGDYHALIGGKAYKTGDQLGSETIIEITATAVTFEYDGGTRTISLVPDKAKIKSSSGVIMKKAP